MSYTNQIFLVTTLLTLMPHIFTADRLCYAASKNNVAEIQRLTDSGIDPNATNESQHTPLFCAIVHNRANAIKALAKAGAHLNHPDKYGKRPLQIAIIGQCVDAIQALVECDADINDQDPTDKYSTPLHQAATGCAQIVNILAQHGADIDALDCYDETPLHYAAYTYNTNAIKILIKHRANKKILNYVGKTPADLITNNNPRDCECIHDMPLKTLIDWYTPEIARLFSNSALKKIVTCAYKLHTGQADHTKDSRLLEHILSDRTPTDGKPQRLAKILTPHKVRQLFEPSELRKITDQLASTTQTNS